VSPASTSASDSPGTFKVDAQATSAREMTAHLRTKSIYGQKSIRGSAKHA
jgi:hypothetical protein